MNSFLVDKLAREFEIIGRKEGGWFVLRINPLPPIAELSLVVSDIEQIRAVGVSGRGVTHLDDCKSEHVISSEVVTKALTNLENLTYTVAVCLNETSNSVLRKQPIAVCLEPEITYRVYPDHPHLNSGFFDEDSQYYFPDSFCYTDNPDALGESEFDRAIAGLNQITLWLLRHHIWLETRKYVPKGVWIGPNAESFPSFMYPRVINPEGRCHCGSNAHYRSCHLNSDLRAWEQEIVKLEKVTLNHAREFINFFIKSSHDNWIRTINIPSRKSLKELRSL